MTHRTGASRFSLRQIEHHRRLLPVAELGLYVSTRGKWVVAAIGIALVVFMAPVAWSAFGTNAYFEDGR